MFCINIILTLIFFLKVSIPNNELVSIDVPIPTKHRYFVFGLVGSAVVLFGIIFVGGAKTK